MERKGWLAVGAFAVLTAVVFVLGLSGAGSSGAASFADSVVPGDVDLVARVDVGPMRRLILQPWVGSEFEEWPAGGLWGDPAIEEEVKGVLLERLGFHPHEVRRATVFARFDDEAVAAVLDAEWEGTPKGEGDDHEGVTIYEANRYISYAVVDGRLVVGTKRGVRAAVDAWKGKAESLATSEGLKAKRHRELAEVAAGAPVHVSIDLSGMPEREMKMITGGEVLEGVAVALTGDGIWHVYGQGEPAALDSMKRHYENLIASGMGMLESEKERAKKGADTFEAVMAVLGTHGVKQLRDKLVLERSGRHLEARLEIEGTSSMIPMLGVMAAVSIPAFMKYMDRAKRAQFEVEEQQRAQERLLRELRDEERAFPADEPGASPGADE